MKKELEKPLGSQKSQKIPMPEEYQVRIALNEFDKEQLLKILNIYILKSHHLNLIGTAFRGLDEYSLAEKAYKDAIELEPEYDEPYGNLLSLYIAQHKYDLCENVYCQGMNKANKKTFIIYQDGRLSFIKGNYEQSLMAARAILMDDITNSEDALVLGLHSILSLIKHQKDTDKYFDEAVGMWKIGISLFPESQQLRELSEYFEDNE